MRGTSCSYGSSPARPARHRSRGRRESTDRSDDRRWSDTVGTGTAGPWTTASRGSTHGLPRIQELFEARIPKGLAPISEFEGTVRIEEPEKARKIVVVPDDGSEEVAYQVSMRARLLVSDGDRVTVGQQLVQGTVNPHEVLRILGSREVQLHLVHEVQEVYRSPRACRSTTSTSRSSSGRCSSG